jgi:hypothetical protein
MDKLMDRLMASETTETNFEFGPTVRQTSSYEDRDGELYLLNFHHSAEPDTYPANSRMLYLT